ncbi:MAG: carboxypeptidase-like regulatory domain-containing protein, partial [Prevotella sp.]|nr:carboxypeptidase-like regulatory domain-containing protein [Prevotella sp.]
MDLKFKKSVMLMGVCSVLGAALPSDAYAGAKESPVAAVQQAKKVHGTVTDDMGPVIGATVKIKGTNNGVITDFDGKYSINAKPGDVLVITFVGAKPYEVTIGNASTYNIKLESNSQELEEVVVVGYGVQKKKLVTGATVEVKGENIAKLNTTQALGALQSQTPGVNIQASSGQPGDGFKVTI